jgi:transposase-like protein
MSTQKLRRKLSSEFKAKIALEALKEKNSLEELAKKYEVHPVQISNWKKEANEKLSQVFGKPKQDTSVDMEKQLEKLYAQIGQLKVENDF